ncbi:hypothetical protein FH972_000570 [Carpinus fangiana]|uniref:Uncharacterized protein n=1 Tax=Carpinus fangiana TaxID=176857 RepID=A0A5N6QC74_9ROSI|nr:hypothetical protein FH972_000570 [Carpinus fangiana]
MAPLLQLLAPSGMARLLINSFTFLTSCNSTYISEREREGSPDVMTKKMTQKANSDEIFAMKPWVVLELETVWL